MKLIYLSLIIFLLNLHFYSYGNDDKLNAPYLIVKKDQESSNNMHLPLVSSKTSVDIVGPIAHVKLGQIYINQFNKAIELEYCFPMSDQTEIHGLKMEIGNRNLWTEMRTVEEAEHLYNEALLSKKAVPFLRTKRHQVVHVNIGELPKGDTIKILLSYTEILTPQEGVYSFKYPTNVQPRFRLTRDHKEILAKKMNSRKLTSNDFYFRVFANILIKQIISESHHELTADFFQEKKGVISLVETGNWQGDRDFIVQYNLRDEVLSPFLILYEGEKGVEMIGQEVVLTTSCSFVIYDSIVGTNLKSEKAVRQYIPSPRTIENKQSNPICSFWESSGGFRCRPMPKLGYTLVKRYRIDGKSGARKEIIYSLVLASGNSYVLDIKSCGPIKGLMVEILDDEDKVLVSSLYNGRWFDQISYRSRATKIYKLRISFNEKHEQYKGEVVLGFQR